MQNQKLKNKVKIIYDLENPDIIQKYELIINGKKEQGYETELIIPNKKDRYNSIIFVVGNPATHSAKNGFPYSYKECKKGRKRHPFWAKLISAEILKEFREKKNIHECAEGR